MRSLGIGFLFGRLFSRAGLAELSDREIDICNMFKLVLPEADLRALELSQGPCWTALATILLTRPIDFSGLLQTANASRTHPATPLPSLTSFTSLSLGVGALIP